jgi:hypothetical protein
MKLLHPRLGVRVGVAPCSGVVICCCESIAKNEGKGQLPPECSISLSTRAKAFAIILHCLRN